jgi:murein DD-endopeptidase MepM/ murein hydrolase activator NlpD
MLRKQLTYRSSSLRCSEDPTSNIPVLGNTSALGGITQKKNPYQNLAFSSALYSTLPYAILITQLLAASEFVFGSLSKTLRTFPFSFSVVNERSNSSPPLRSIAVSPLEDSLFTPTLLTPEADKISGVIKSIAAVNRGETLSIFLSRLGVESKSIKEIYGALGPKSAMVRANEEIDIIRSSISNRIIEIRKSHPAKGAPITVALNDQGRFVNTEPFLIIDKVERRIGGVIRSSLAATAVDLKIPYPIIDDLVDLFGEKVDFRKDVKRGDAFSLIFEEKRDQQSRLVSHGAILAASLRVGNKTFVAVRYVGKDGKARYFDEKGKTSGEGFLRYPLAFSRISSVFSNARFHPVLNIFRPHNGVDFAAPVGTPVRSIGDGRVVQAGYHGASGILVKIQHSKRYSTAYLHLSRVGNGIRNGTYVKRGQIIGNVGMTGRTTGPHLHFSLYDYDKYVDPLKTALPSIIERENQIPEKLLVAKIRELNEQHNLLALNNLSSTLPRS